MSSRALALVAACVTLGPSCTAFESGDPSSRDHRSLDPVVREETSEPERISSQQAISQPSELARSLRLHEEPWTGDLDGMVARRMIRVLVSPSRTSYFLDGPVQRGIAYDGSRLLQRWVNDELDTGVLQVHVVLVPVPRDRLLPALIGGRGDIASASLTITPERLEQVDFSSPLMEDVRELVVTGPASPVLETLDDLAGQEVYVRASSPYFDSLQSLSERFRRTARPPVTLRLAEEYLEDEDLLEMLDAGLLPLIVVDEHRATFWSRVFTHIVVRTDLALRTGGSVGLAFRKNSPLLADLLNRFVDEHREGTLMGNMLLNRYLRSTKYVQDALANQDAASFRDTLDLFRTYASRYGFDPLLTLAMGYQESRLDQSLVSSRGAVGVMQLMPSTAADPRVGVPDITGIEDNVHAGIRYLRWIRDTFFADAALDDVNRTLFSFASYNAGPNRIRRLRSEAAARGLDPDVWFQNVEVVVAEDIGRETVQYVSNIYKYYAAYRLLAEREAMRRRR